MSDLYITISRYIRAVIEKSHYLNYTDNHTYKFTSLYLRFIFHFTSASNNYDVTLYDSAGLSFILCSSKKPLDFLEEQ